MTQRGWSLNALQFPTCLHLCVTLRQVGKSAVFLRDLALALAHFRENPSETNTSEGSAIYGIASTLPAGPVDELLRTYADVTLQP